MRSYRDSSCKRERSGFVLVAVLIVVVILALAAYKFVDLMTSEYRASARTNDAAQARLCATSGVHYAAAALADPNTLSTQLGGNPFAASAFSPQVVRPGTTPGLEGRFALVAVAQTAPGTYEQRFGAVIDESGKLNINALILQDPSGQVLYNALLALPNMTPDVADAIVDWVDADDTARPSGVESAYYQALAKPYRAKNGPLNTLDEILLVRGVTPQLLYGNDRNRNGLADDDPGGSPQFDRGWCEFLTVYGRELNLDAAGVVRTNVNDSEDLPGLYQQLTTRLGPDLADYILAYKMFSLASASASGSSAASTSPGSDGSGGGNAPQQTTMGGPSDLNSAVQTALQGTPANKRRIVGLLDLMNTRVTLPAAANAQPNQPQMVVASPLNDPAKLSQLLPILLDGATTTSAVELPPRINVNTAAREVLLFLSSSSSSAGAALSSAVSSATGGGSSSVGTSGSTLPGSLAESDVDNIIAQRDGLSPADLATQTGAWLLTSGALTPAQFKAVQPYIAGRTMVYRVQAIGYFGQGGPVARVEAVIDTNQGAPRILYFRDLTGLDTPRGFEPPR